MLRPQLLEPGVQVGLEEPAEPRLVDDIVAGLRLEFGNDVRVPGVADQDSALLAIGGRNLFSDARDRRCRTRFTESGAPKSERSGWYPILR